MNTTSMRFRFLLSGFLLVLLVFGGGAGLRAQVGELAVGRFVYVTPKAGTLPQKAECVDEAGSILALTNINAKSSSFAGVPNNGSIAYSSRPDTIFLCRGDAFTIDYDENSGNITGDPDTDTRPGIGYGIYSCDPTIAGPTIQDIVTDDCRLRGGQAPFNSTDEVVYILPPATNYDVGIYDVRILNAPEGQDVPTIFQDAPGQPVPTFIALAATTLDAVSTPTASTRRQPIFEGFDTTINPSLIPGCVNVNLDEVTQLVYLNEVEAVLDIDPSGCSGTVVVSGGITEFTGSPGYVVTLTNTDLGTSTTIENASTTLSGETVSFSSAVPGNYEITVVDSISCDFPPISFSLSVCQSNVPLDITATPTDVTCTGLTDGRITVTANGGTAPYTVTLQRTTPLAPPITPPSTITTDGENTVFENLTGGEYSITVTDAAGDIDRANVDIIQPNLTVEIQVVEAFACFDDNEGSLTAVIFNGANPIPGSEIANYDFQWTSGGTTYTTRTITDVPPGNYSVTATNRNTGCTTTDSENFRAPNRLVIENASINTDPATCNGVSDGTVRITVSGGTQDGGGNYTVNFSDGVSIPSANVSRNDLLPGAYEVEVIDANGCSATSNFVIAAEKTLVLTANSTNISCFGDANGIIFLTAATEGAPADLPYRASLLDSTGTVVRPSTALAGNGSTPLNFNNLEAGTYTVVLRDSDSEGCEVQQTITIVEPALLEIGTPVTTDQGCPDEAGTVTINATGGTGPYTYQFRNDSIPDPMNPMDTLRTFDSTTVDNLNNIGDLMADTNYVVIVTDANGCVDSTTFKIFSPPQARVQPIVTDSVACPGDSDGQLTVIATPPPGDSITIVDYTWYRINNDGSRGEQVDVGRTTSADLSVGFYEVEIALSNECNSSAFGQVASPGLVMLDSFNLIDPACLGESTGSIFVFPTGGTPNADGTYNYEWSTNPGSITTSNNINQLAEGEYSVTITDANGCQPAFDTTFTIVDPVGIVLVGDEPVIDNVSCPSDTITDGIITYEAVFSDGTAGNFDFFFSNGDTILNQASATVGDLPRGPISVTITDGTCFRTFTDTIGSPEDFAFAAETTNASCNGITDGSVTVNVTGGTPAYDFTWVDRTEMSNTLDSVAAGFYQLIVTDANGCVADTFGVVVAEPDPLLLIIDETVTTPLVTCADDEDGVIGVLVISTNNNELGDNPYNWSPSVADDDESVARDLAAGTYSVTVTDVRGCQDTLSYTIVNPQPIQFVLQQPESPLCFGETTTIQLDTVFGGQSSGFGSYTFSIDEDGFLIPADQPGTTFAGQQIITVFDSVGCSVSDTIDIDQPEEIVIELADRIRIELGDTLTQLDPIVTPSTGSYDYRWTPADFLSSDSIRNPFVFPIRDQDYELTVTNENGCVAIDDVLVTIDANRSVFLPNAFSPNQDGVNEEFRLYACLGVQSIDRVGIYNRWGGLIAESEGMLPSCLDGTVLWNGANPKRKLVDPGVYVYVIQITFIDNVQLTYRGDITVIR